MRVLLALFAIGCLLGVAPATATEGDCSAAAEVKLQDQAERDDGMHLEFLVDLTTEESCSEVTYDVILDLKLPNGQWKSVRLSRQAEVQGGSASQTVEHTMADLELLEYRANAISCHRCEI